MIGLVLTGGGVRGSYQMGAYLALKDCGIKIDGVVGTSIGAFNGALIVSEQDDDLYNLWINTDIGEILGFNRKFIDSVNNKNRIKKYLYGITQITNIIKNGGISRDNLKGVLNDIIDEEKIRKSKMDYGLVTIRLDALKTKPMYLYKEDMEKGKIIDCILASCNLPVFKRERLIDNKFYLDGGYYDINPVNMLLKKGYNKVYSVDIRGFGIHQKVIDEGKVVRITPSKSIGTTLNIDRSQILENINLGYYDTLKIIRKYDGYNFIFKNEPKWVYNIMAKKANKELYNKCKNYFNAKDAKETILKSLEYVMQKNNFSYYYVYNPIKVIKYLKNKYTMNNYVYEFIKSIGGYYGKSI